MGDYLPTTATASGTVLAVRDDGLLIRWTNLVSTSSRTHKKPIHQIRETFYEWDDVRKYKLISFRQKEEIDNIYPVGSLVLVSYGRGENFLFTGLVVDNRCHPFIDVLVYGKNGSSRLHTSKLCSVPATKLCWLGFNP